jgi:hypothetical protein
MTESRTIQDVICLAIPEGIDPEECLYGAGLEVRERFIERLTQMAQEQVWTQWPGEQPESVDWEYVEWMITREIEDVQDFQPAHDCAECRLGNVRAEMFLREFPGRWIAMGNLTYTANWRE